MRKRFLWMLPLYLLVFSHLAAQNLFDLVDEEEEVTADFVINTFFSTRVINGQSVENPYPGDLIFVVSHHFGRLNQGFYDLFGLDQATIRLGLEYGVNDRLALAVGRSSFEKTYDAFLKYKILRQQTGLRDVPVSYNTNHTFSVGFDLDTGGHVFQLHFTNAQPMFEPGFLTGTQGSWLDGDIYFGFHIARTFGF